MNIIEQINSHKFLYLTEIGEPNDNSLRIVIEQATTGEEQNIQVGTAVVSNCRNIISDETCFAYELIFENYIAYCVLNESFAEVDNLEVFTGNLFRIYSKSNYLEYIKVATFATEDYPGVFSHYEIVALNHIIEIVSVDLPKINVLRVPMNQDLSLENIEYEN